MEANKRQKLEQKLGGKRDIVAEVEAMARVVSLEARVLSLSPLSVDHLDMYAGRTLLARQGTRTKRFVRIPTDGSDVNTEVSYNKTN